MLQVIEILQVRRCPKVRIKRKKLWIVEDGGTENVKGNEKKIKFLQRKKLTFGIGKGEN